MSTTVYSQVLIYTAESTRASMEITKIATRLTIRNTLSCMRNLMFPMRNDTLSVTKYICFIAYCIQTRLPGSFSPFLTISLCMAGRYFSHPVFSTVCHVFCQLAFLHVSLYVAPQYMFWSASSQSPRNV